MKIIISLALIWAAFHYGSLEAGLITTVILLFLGFFATIKEVMSDTVVVAQTGEKMELTRFLNHKRMDAEYAQKTIKIGFGVSMLGTLLVQNMGLNLDELTDGGGFFSRLRVKLLLSGMM